VRVACVMRWPARIKAGSASNEMLHAVDIYPTLVQLGGGSLEQPLPLDGRDAWPTITQGKASPHTEIVLSVPGFEDSETGTPAIRVGDFKLVGDELYDIRRDPYEKNNIASTHPDQVTSMKSRLAQLAAERRKPEAHEKISNSRVVVFGEEENKTPLPEWLLNAAKNAEDDPATVNAKKGGKKKRNREVK